MAVFKSVMCHCFCVLTAPKLRELRIPGVLQRFAGTYLIIATMHMFFAKPTDPNQVSLLSELRLDKTCLLGDGPVKHKLTCTVTVEGKNLEF